MTSEETACDADRGVVSTPQIPGTEGESPMFGANVGRMSHHELERHMEDLFATGSHDAPRTSHSSSDGSGEGRI